MDRETAVVVIGNPGSGKATLLTQISSSTLVSTGFHNGFTNKAREEMITLNGKRILLIDVPGLYEPSEKGTQQNTKRLTDALSKSYDYYLYFIMKAENRGPTDAEMVTMSKINDCIKQTNGSRVSFRVIVNHIMSQELYDLYQEHMVNDNCKSLLKSLEIPGCSFNIKIDSVSLVRFEETNMNSPFRDILIQDIIRKEKPPTRMTAILLFGNAGAGKSTLLTQLGGTKFKSGATFRTGFTKKVEQERVTLSSGQTVILIDVPGLFEPSEKATQNNALELNLALRLEYEFKFFFIMKADNRGPSDAEMVMMSKVNECIKTSYGSRVSFRVIVNQIMSDEVNKIYEDNVAKDNCKSLFQDLNIPGFSFDIKIDSVMLLRYSPEDVSCGGFKAKMEEEVYQHSEQQIRVTKLLEISNADLTFFQKAILAFMSLFKVFRR
ncbi:hypothetical protein CPB97_006992 [Podila verticillata]|nr:hypothetical protein CPB97_006992 [Podila verticillata]